MQSLAPAPAPWADLLKYSPVFVTYSATPPPVLSAAPSEGLKNSLAFSTTPLSAPASEGLLKKSFACSMYPGWSEAGLDLSPLPKLDTKSIGKFFMRSVEEDDNRYFCKD
ncbi:hypothetical protein ABFS83_12G094500 [Erythranthe nasuta]